MVTFLINLDNKRIENLTRFEFLFYPYYKENKLIKIEKENDLSTIAIKIENEIKNKRISKFQIIIVTPYYDNSEKYFAKNFAMQMNRIEKSLVLELKEKQIKPNKVSVISCDYFEEFMKEMPRDLNAKVAQDLTKYGYADIFNFTESEISEIIKYWEDNKFDAAGLERLEHKVVGLVEDKKDEMKNSEIGSMKDSPLNSNVKLMDAFARSIGSKVKHSVDKGKFFDNPEKEVYGSLIEANFFFSYLIQKNDLDSIKEKWNRIAPKLVNQDSYNLSSDFIMKLTEAKEEIKRFVDEVIDKKIKIIETVSENELENIYLNTNKLNQIKKDFEIGYIKNILEKIITDKKIDGNLHDIPAPQDRLVRILERRYSVSSLEETYNFFKMTFLSNDTREQQKEAIKLTYLILYLMEDENVEITTGHRKKLKVLDVRFNEAYTSRLADIYYKKLSDEVGFLSTSRKSITQNREINLLKVKDATFIAVDIPHEKLKEAGIQKNYNDFKDYEEWTKNTEDYFNKLIKISYENLEEYQVKKSQFLETTTVIDFNDEKEIEKYEKIRREKAANLDKAGEKVDLDIKSTWNKFLNDNLKNRNEEIFENESFSEIKLCKDQYKSFLNERPELTEKVCLYLGVLFFSLMMFGWVEKLNKWSYSSYLIGIMITIIVIFEVVNNMKIKKTLNRFAKINNETRDTYEIELSRKIESSKLFFDALMELRVAEKNKTKVQNEVQKTRIEEEKFRYYLKELQEHLDSMEKFKEVIKSSRNNISDNNFMNDENFKKNMINLDLEKSPIENPIFSPINYIEILSYLEFYIEVDNSRQRYSNVKNIFGCYEIKFETDNSY